MVKRNTPQKKIVLQTLADMKNHPTASMVYEEVHGTHPTISKSTVFRILGNAAEDGDVLKLHIIGSDERFDHQCHNHYHIKCRKCGRVDDIMMPYMDHLNEQIIDSCGYIVERHDTQFTGICKDCRNRSESFY